MCTVNLLFYLCTSYYCLFYQVKDEYVESISHDIQVLDEQHISAYIKVIYEIGSKVRNGGYNHYNTFRFRIDNPDTELHD